MIVITKSHTKGKMINNIHSIDYCTILKFIIGLNAQNNTFLNR